MQALDLAVSRNLLYQVLNIINGEKLVCQFYRVQSSLSNYPQLIQFVLYGLLVGSLACSLRPEVCDLARCLSYIADWTRIDKHQNLSGERYCKSGISIKANR